jgi:hypothetical protein
MNKQGKSFFSEEKTQKTFVPALADTSGSWPEHGEAAAGSPVFRQMTVCARGLGELRANCPLTHCVERATPANAHAQSS